MKGPSQTGMNTLMLLLAWVLPVAIGVIIAATTVVNWWQGGLITVALTLLLPWLADRYFHFRVYLEERRQAREEGF